MIRFAADDERGRWKAGDLGEDLGVSALTTLGVPIHLLIVLRTGERVQVATPYADRVIERA